VLRSACKSGTYRIYPAELHKRGIQPPTRYAYGYCGKCRVTLGDARRFGIVSIEVSMKLHVGEFDRLDGIAGTQAHENLAIAV